MVGVFALGLVIAFLVDETTGLKPGGYIVPGYLAISATEPARLGATFALVLCILVVLAAADRLLLLYGSRRFAFTLLTGCVFKSALAAVFPYFGLVPVGLLVIGFLIPGLVAHSCDRQGMWKTLAALMLATILTKLVAMAVFG